jgi:uncharacterized delta-60 repeat protein
LEKRTLLSGASVDESFGTQGGVLFWHQKPAMFVTGKPSVVVQGDGKILVTGHTTVGNGSPGTIVRLNSNGSIDTSFADQGFYRFSSGARPDEVRLALQPDQKIVAVASKEIIRLDATGQLDTSFGGGDGRVATSASLADVELLSNGNIIVGGDSEVVRYTSSGVLDGSFGSGGRVDVGSVAPNVSDVDVLPGGGVLVTGLVGGNYEPVLVKLTASGVVDKSFGANGSVHVTPPPNSLPFEETLVESTGAIVIGTTWGTFRYDASGVQDPLYGAEPSVSLSTPSGPRGGWVLQPDDRVIQGAYGSYGIAAERLDVHGIPDSSFGSVGTWFTEIVVSDTAPSGFARGATLVGNQLMMAGSFGNGGWLMVVRFNIDPSGPGSTGHVTGTGTLVVDGTQQADKITVFSLSKTMVGVMREGVGTEYFEGVERVICSAGDGDDEVTVGIDVPVTLNGEAGKDKLSSSSHSGCLLDGGDGDDYLGSGAGNDTLHGGAGDDALYAGGGSDRLFGEAGNDSIMGGEGNNTMYGGDGNDTLKAGSGRDYFGGGSGSDTADYSDLNFATPALRLSLDGVANDGGKNERDNVLTDVEHVIGGPKADYIVGNGLANRLDGFEGDDTIIGGSGNDTLVGGDGVNVLSGGKGSDTVDFSLLTEAVTVSLMGAGPVKVRKGETDSLVSVECVVGGKGNDRIVGSEGANVLSGGAGNDTIVGGGGADGIFGGAGKDKLYGGAGNDYLEGGSGDDVISGDAGSDTMLGQGGMDLMLSLDREKDSLDGGSGNDRGPLDKDLDAVIRVESLG